MATFIILDLPQQPIGYFLLSRDYTKILSQGGTSFLDLHITYLLPIFILFLTDFLALITDWLLICFYWFCCLLKLGDKLIVTNNFWVAKWVEKTYEKALKFQ